MPCIFEGFPSRTLTASAAGAAGGAAITYLLMRSLYGVNVNYPKESREIYETNQSNNQYMEFHFTPGKDSFVHSLKDVSDAFDFPIRLGRLFEKYLPTGGLQGKRALDLGCATGMSTLEMSKYFDEVVGIDLSVAFIASANKIKNGDVVPFDCPDQGHITVSRNAQAPKDTFPARCQFLVGDALNVDEKLGKFDAILVANLLCRLPEPIKLLKSFSGLINKGGVLVLVSPYSWWEGATVKESWIGGTPGKARSEEQVKEILSTDFELLDEHDEPFFDA
eukprot:Tbor_TRINITY_DN6162_c0_g5::TRINITY_DN6162_c0_g5_i1::g.22435::m.22435